MLFAGEWHSCDLQCADDVSDGLYEQIYRLYKQVYNFKLVLGGCELQFYNFKLVRSCVHIAYVIVIGFAKAQYALSFFSLGKVTYLG